jgi:hypothetical protein
MSADTRPFCTALKKNGEPCKGRALPGRDVCMAHRLTGDALAEHARKAQAAQARARRAKKRDFAALRSEVTEARALDVAAKCLSGVPLNSPDSARTYMGRRQVTHEGTIIGLHLLLYLTGPHLSPSAARSALEQAVPPGLRPSYMPPVEDVYQAARAEWRRSAIRYSEAAGLFTLPYPPTMYATWESIEQVNEAEPMPDLSAYSVEPLGDSLTHVHATSPDGERVIVLRQKALTAASV